MKRPAGTASRLKNTIAALIVQRMGARKGRAAATMLGIDEPDVSRLVTGQLARFSIERLLTIMDRTGAPNLDLVEGLVALLIADERVILWLHGPTADHLVDVIDVCQNGPALQLHIADVWARSRKTRRKA